MTKRHWREWVEIVGVVGIVAAVLVLATQIRQSNHIAAAQLETQLAQTYHALHIKRATDSSFAKLFPKLAAPKAHLTTATETSQIRGIAWHFVNALWSVHSAYEKGLISREARDLYIVDFTDTLRQWPGLRSHFVHIYEDFEYVRNARVFAPIAEYIEPQAAAEEP